MNFMHKQALKFDIQLIQLFHNVKDKHEVLLPIPLFINYGLKNHNKTFHLQQHNYVCLEISYLSQ